MPQERRGAHGRWWCHRRQSLLSVRTQLLQSTVSTMMGPSPFAPLPFPATGQHQPRSRMPLDGLRALRALAFILLGLATTAPLASAGTQAVPQTLEFDIARQGDIV